jgi:hypothetical protein
MTTISHPSGVRVFRHDDWTNPTAGVWEATATNNAYGRPTFEAVAIHTTDPNNGGGSQWQWVLYQPLVDEPAGPGEDGLGCVAEGNAPTLAAAQYQADQAARRWRDLQHHPLEVRP